MTAETTPVVLAVDLGTSGMKVALVTTQGRVLGWESQGITLQLTPDGGAEQSPTNGGEHSSTYRSACSVEGSSPKARSGRSAARRRAKARSRWTATATRS